MCNIRLAFVSPCIMQIVVCLVFVVLLRDFDQKLVVDHFQNLTGISEPKIFNCSNV